MWLFLGKTLVHMHAAVKMTRVNLFNETNPLGDEIFTDKTTKSYLLQTMGNHKKCCIITLFVVLNIKKLHEKLHIDYKTEGLINLN